MLVMYNVVMYIFICIMLIAREYFREKNTEQFNDSKVYPSWINPSIPGIMHIIRISILVW